MFYHQRLIHRLASAVCCLTILFGAAGYYSQTFAQGAEHHEAENADDHSSSRFSDEPIPLADLPRRPKPIIELGEPFLGTGTLKQGIRLPTGAVWQPALLAFGTFRSALQSVQRNFNKANEIHLTEAAFRFDLFGNLYLTSSERVLVGFRPFDQNGNFTRYTIDTNLPLDEEENNFEHELNFGVRTLFFEGDLGEIFPAFDWKDKRGLDIGISVGRQPLNFQDGMLINEDAIDAVGLTRANLKFRKLVNMRVTGLFAWDDIDRPNGQLAPASRVGLNQGDKSAMLFGLFTETDTRKWTLEADAIVVLADAMRGDGIYAGLGSTRRFGRFGNTWRIVGSMPIGDEGLHNSQGLIITEQLSWTPHHSHNFVYISAFVGIQEFRSAARGPANGGPLGRIGILYSAFGIGRFGAALGNQADNAAGGSVGYQIFFAETRQQVIIELGGRANYKDEGNTLNDAAGGAVRYQIAVQRRGVIVADVFGVYDLEASAPTFGGRLELVIKL